MKRFTEQEAVGYQPALLNALEKGIVLFLYQKKDGTMRYAFGTKNKDLIPVSRTVGEKYGKLLDKVSNLIDKQEAFKQVEHLEDDLKNRADYLTALDGVDVAYGLLLLEMPKPKKASTPREPNPEMIMYWDFEAQDIRNFNANQLRGMYVPEEENNEN